MAGWGKVPLGKVRSLILPEKKEAPALSVAAEDRPCVSRGRAAGTCVLTKVWVGVLQS